MCKIFLIEKCLYKGPLDSKVLDLIKDDHGKRLRQAEIDQASSVSRRVYMILIGKLSHPGQYQQRKQG